MAKKKSKHSSGFTREEYIEKMKQKNDDVDSSNRSKKNSTSANNSKSKSKTNTTKKNQKKNQKKNNPKRKKLRKTILIIILIVVLIGIITTIVSMVNFGTMAKQMVQNKPSSVLDDSNSEVAKIGEERNRENISIDKVPENLKNAYISIEDQRYYSHIGIDIRRTLGATVDYVTSFGNASFGGSTITQQLAKNLTGNTSSTISRKLEEWKEAVTLEIMFSKDEILEAYLNIIYVGPNIYGVEMGSKYYFSKDVSDLSLAECAYLAGINNSPNSYNPFNDDDNQEKIRTRTITVLDKMLELGYITDSEYDSAVGDVNNGLAFNKGDIETKSSVYSYHVDALISELISDLSERKNITETFAENYIYMANLRIYSTQVTSVQTAVEDECQRDRYILNSTKNEGETSQTAMVVIDQSTGYVTGIVGGLGEKTTSRGFNRATQAKRQTGSAMKPVAILAPGIEEKLFTASTVYDDTVVTFDDGTEEGYTPDDYDTPLGNITVRAAVESSQNVPFVYMMQELTPKKSISYLEKMGVTTLTEADDNLSLALGGLVDGMTPLEFAGAYATIANDGVYIEPTFYTKIENSKGRTVFRSRQESYRVFSEETSYIVKSLLTQPVEGSRGTATYCKIDGMDVAAKTGTTNENYDRWLCGFTNYYTAVTWYGYDENETVNYNGRNPAGLIWANVMNNIHSQLGNSKFVKPNGVQTATVCSGTGNLANGYCSSTYLEYFLRGTIPGSCKVHNANDTDSGTTIDVVQERIQEEQNVEIDEVESVVTNEEEEVNNTNDNNYTYEETENNYSPPVEENTSTSTDENQTSGDEQQGVDDTSQDDSSSDAETPDDGN